VSEPIVVGGRLELLDLVGRGGQGEVWRASDVRHSRNVAVKVHRGVRGDEREALMGEARVLLDVRPHPGLPVVREDFFENDDYFIVMDWVDGTSLDRLVERHGAPGLPLPTVLPYLRQIASCLDHLHRHEPPVIHRDVKPANVIVRPDGGVVLVDFGISSRRDLPGQRSAGTRAFQAPELASEAQPSADVYGLAATAVTLLTGAPPFPGPRPPIRGVGDAESAHVWRVLEEGLAYDPSRRPVTCAGFVASLAPPDAGTNLVTPTSRFIGRGPELEAITDALSTNRVVTLVAAGGLGKTRLATEAATRIAPAYPDGVWIAELAPVRSPEHVAQAVAAVFGVEASKGRVFDELLLTLRDRNALVILDNCEHVLSACTSLVDRIVGGCEGIDVIATSRERLGSSQEVVHEVRPLQTPEAEDAPIKSVALTESIRLFLDRAPDVRFDAETAPLLTRICRRLDGMPLAIELAASRAARLSLTEIAARLEDRFMLLRTEDDATPRHQTLRAAFEWSLELLTDEQRDLFACLSVLPGGADARSAAAVCTPGRESADVYSDIEELVTKSLVVRTTTDERYSMLESVRSFASDVLREAGDTDAVRDRALVWAMTLVDEAAGQLRGPERAVWLRHLETELDNIREVLADTVDRLPLDAMRLATSLDEFWVLRGHWTEARRYLESCLAVEGGTVEVRSEALAVAGRLAYLEADYDAARRFHGDALRLRKAVADRAGEAASLSSLGMVAEARTDFASARDLYGQSLQICRELGDRRGAAEQLANLGSVAEYSSDFDVALALHSESLQMRRELGDAQGVATTLLNLGYVMNYRGDPAGKEALEESAAVFTEVGDRYGASRALNLLAIRAWFEGDGEKARSLGESAMRMRHEIGDRLGIAVSLESLAGLAAFQGFAVYAGELFGAAERLRELIDSPVMPSDQMLLQWAHNDAKNAIGESVFDAARQRGRGMRTEDAIALSLTRP
jgi:predicted ATPase